MCDDYLRQAINYMAQNDECKFPEFCNHRI